MKLINTDDETRLVETIGSVAAVHPLKVGQKMVGRRYTHILLDSEDVYKLLTSTPVPHRELERLVAQFRPRKL